MAKVAVSLLLVSTPKEAEPEAASEANVLVNGDEFRKYQICITIQSFEKGKKLIDQIYYNCITFRNSTISIILL